MCFRILRGASHFSYSLYGEDVFLLGLGTCLSLAMDFQVGSPHGKSFGNWVDFSGSGTCYDLALSKTWGDLSGSFQPSLLGLTECVFKLSIVVFLVGFTVDPLHGGNARVLDHLDFGQRLRRVKLAFSYEKFEAADHLSRVRDLINLKADIELRALESGLARSFPALGWWRKEIDQA
jgi:hypothetical protein